MGFQWKFACALALVLGFVGPSFAQNQEVIPARRAVILPNADLPGGDIASYFQTTLEACEKACLLNDKCDSFTFNNRNGSCFAKAGMPEPSFFAAATSAILLSAEPEKIARGERRRAELGFLPDADLTESVTLARSLGYEYSGPALAFDDVLAAAWSAMDAGDPDLAVSYMAVAVNAEDSVERWQDFALMSSAAAQREGPKQQQHKARVLSAWINAYLRAEGAGLQHDILRGLALALEEAGRGPLSLQALRLAQDLDPRPEAAALLETAAGKYGFNIADHIVNSDLARPEICVDFSEALIESGVDYGDYFRVDDATDYSVELSGARRLCLRGLNHGQNFSAALRRGLPAADGQILHKDVEIKGYIRDRSPLVRFAGRGYVMSNAAETAVPLETVNADRVELTLFEVSDRNILRAIQNDYFGRPIGIYQEDYFADMIGAQMWRGTAEVQMQVNQELTTRLPMTEALAGRAAGVYALRAAVAGRDSYDVAPAWQWFVVSDLGMTTMRGADGLHVFVRSLKDASAKAGVEVALYNNANALLAKVQADAAGYAHFEPGLIAGNGAAAPALLVLRDGEADISFLSLTGPEFDLSDRGVEGRAPAKALDLFMTSDRGVYRAGETIHVTALARDLAAHAVENLALTAVFRRPDGVEHSRQSVTDRGAGGYVFALETGADVARGTWAISLHAGADTEALAQKTILIEDFLPERIAVELTPDQAPLRLEDGQAKVLLQADYLFGAPAAGLAVEGELYLVEAEGLKAWPNYAFGRHDQRFDAVQQPFDQAFTDDQGHLALTAALPYLEEIPARPLRAKLVARVAEGSGRPIERSLDLPVEAARALLGIKPEFEDVVPEGGKADFLLAAVDGADAAVPMAVKWTLTRVETNYQWYRYYSDWQWEPVTTRSQVASGEARLDGTPFALSLPVEWGQYELLVEAVGKDLGRASPASILFDAGWYAPADVSLTPDMLELSLDRRDYRAGDTAVLRMVPRQAGIALINVVSNRLIHMQAIDVVAGENLVSLDVTEEWGAGAYVTASVLRPAKGTEAGQDLRLPARALGLAYAQIDPGPLALTVEIKAEAEASPRANLPVAVKVEGVAAGDTAFVTLAAVDQGILNLTGFKAPDPKAHYFGQQKLGMGIRDIYGRLIDNMSGGLGLVRSGGDAGAQMRMQSPPPTEELVAYFSGPITVGADGYARTDFDLPSFNGQVRLMAVAWSKTAIGQAEAEVLVRDPVVVAASVPRFMAPGDTSRLRLEFTHVTGAAGEMALVAEITGEALGLAKSLPASFTLGEKGRHIIEAPIEAFAPGLAKISLSLTTPDGQILRKDLQLPVEVNDNQIMRLSQIELAPGQSLTLDDSIFTGLYLASSESHLALGAGTGLNAPALLASLIRYPYGCTEQTTSRAMPLLYLSQAEAQAVDAKRQINEAILRVLNNQNGSGQFGLWGAGGDSLWLDAYVSDFLTQARAEGYDVPQTGLRQALDNLRSRVNYASDFDANTPEGGTGLAYALMVLAREGAAAIGDLRYYVDVKADDFATPLAQAQLGAALAFYGDQTRADKMMRKAAARILETAPRAEAQIIRSDFGSDLRDTAGVLALAHEVGSTAIARDALFERLMHPERSLSTQEAAWALRAASALTKEASPGAKGLHIAGNRRVGQSYLPGDAALTIENDGNQTEVVQLTTFGVPIEPEASGGNGYTIRRDYFTLAGQRVDLDQELAAGTRLVALLEITPWAAGEGRLLIDDPLPAGFEIDNPSLISGGEVGQFSWLGAMANVQHTEFRQDRFLAQVDWTEDRGFQLAYVVRAISPGGFHHPAVTLEDMYRPSFNARSDTGFVMIGER